MSSFRISTCPSLGGAVLPPLPTEEQRRALRHSKVLGNTASFIPDKEQGKEDEDI
jgi:hypothetical protein